MQRLEPTASTVQAPSAAFSGEVQARSLQRLGLPHETSQATENAATQPGIVRDRAPGIVGGMVTGMAVPVIVVGGVAAIGAAALGGGGGGGVDCCYVGGGGSGGGGALSKLKPTTWGAFGGSFSGAVAVGVALGYEAFKAAGNKLTNAAIGPILKGWGIGGVAGTAGAVATVAAVEGWKSHRAHGEQQRRLGDPELALQPRGSYHGGPIPAPAPIRGGR
jgi:hypothetical protein